MTKISRNIIAVLFLTLLLSPQTKAQSGNDSSFNIVTFLSRNFNPGINFSVAGSAPHYYWPTLSLRTGPLSLNAVTYHPFIDNRAWSYQADLEIFRFQDRNQVINRNSYLTLSGGTIKVEEFTEPGRNTYQTLFGMAGINHYLPNGRSKFSVKVGGAYFWTNMDIDDWRDVETHKWGPYGELSYKMYLLKIRERQRFSTPSTDSAGYLAYKKHHRETTEPKYPWISKWLNPYWSLGVGLDRVMFTPAGGLKVGPVNAKWSAWVNDVESFLSINANYDHFLSQGKNYSRYISLGMAITGGGGSDGLSASDRTVYGPMVGYTALKNHGRSGFEAKIGLGRLTNSSSYHDFDDNEWKEHSSTSTVPMFGVSYNLYLFRFGGKH